MMKTMSNSLGFSTNLIFLATPLLFNQAYASITNTCSILHLLGTQSIYQKYQVSSGPIVNHGTYKGCEKADTHTGECLDYVFGQTTFAYGPDIDFEFKERNSGKTAKIRVQQNYCFFEAGNISVQVKKGRFEYIATKGNYDDNKPGLVEITSIEGD